MAGGLDAKGGEGCLEIRLELQKKMREGGWQRLYVLILGLQGAGLRTAAEVRGKVEGERQKRCVKCEKGWKLCLCFSVT